MPALLYTIQNNLTFVGAAHLSVVAFQATNQLRIPATALVATLVLGQDIGRRLALSLSLGLSLSISVLFVSSSNNSSLGGGWRAPWHRLRKRRRCTEEVGAHDVR